jgi:hypothetical protein
MSRPAEETSGTVLRDRLVRPGWIFSYKTTVGQILDSRPQRAVAPARNLPDALITFVEAFILHPTAIPHLRQSC